MAQLWFGTAGFHCWYMLSYQLHLFSVKMFFMSAIFLSFQLLVNHPIIFFFFSFFLLSMHSYSICPHISSSFAHSLISYTAFNTLFCFSQFLSKPIPSLKCCFYFAILSAMGSNSPGNTKTDWQSIVLRICFLQKIQKITIALFCTVFLLNGH